MKLTDALNCFAALSALDGRQKIVKDGGEEKVVVEPYTFTGATRMAIARNMSALAAEQKSYNEARIGLIKQFSNGADQVPADKMGEFTEEVQKLLEADCPDIKIKKLTEADLNFAVNPLAPSVIAGLLPMLEDPV
jgi:hypothetical protein